MIGRNVSGAMGDKLIMQMGETGIERNELSTLG